MSKAYYKVEVLVEVDDTHWDSGCDETFGIGYVIDDAKSATNIKHISNYEKIDKKYFDQHKFDVFTPGGGI